MFKLGKHRQRDHERVSYLLSFPSDLKHEQLVAWLRAISRTVTTSKLNLGASATVAFELIATDTGISHRIRVPWQHQDHIIQQLRTLAPGVSAAPEERLPDIHWTLAIELGESAKDRPLDIPAPDIMAASLLGATQPLAEGEAAILQWVVAPARPERLPDGGDKSTDFRIAGIRIASSDELKERRAKLAEPNMMAVLRVAARANTEARAKHLVGRIHTSLRAVERYPNKWTSSTNSQATLKDRVHRAASMVVWPAQLTVSELAALIAWPIGSPNVSGLPRGAARQLPANLSVPREGVVIGHSTFPGAERPVAISYRGGFEHTHIMAGTGAGKTTLLANMVEQDMKAGHTVIVMEPKGDLFYQALARVPRERWNDVIIMDLEDTAYPVGFNLLAQGNSRVAVSNIKNLFEYQFPDIKRGVWARAALHRGLQTLITDPRSTVVDLVPLFSPTSRSDPETDWKEALVRGIDDDDLTLFWQRFDNFKPDMQERYASPLLDKMFIINETPEVRNIFGQSESTFTFDQVFSEGKILLVNLSGVPDDAASLAGTFLMQSLWSALTAKRGDMRPAYLYLDEFQSYMKLPISAEEMLAKARSFKLGMRLAHQNLDQLSGQRELQAAIKANARNKIMFNLSSDDAMVMAREFGALVSPHDFQSLRQYEAIAKVVTDEGVSQPFSMKTYPPTQPTADVAWLREESRRKYGKPVDQVRQEIKARRRGPERAPQTRQRPKISGEGW